MLSGKRLSKGINRLHLSRVVFSYATLQGKPLPTSPAEPAVALNSYLDPFALSNFFLLLGFSKGNARVEISASFFFSFSGKS